MILCICVFFLLVNYFSVSLSRCILIDNLISRWHLAVSCQLFYTSDTFIEMGIYAHTSMLMQCVCLLRKSYL